MRVTRKMAKDIGDALGVNWRRTNLEQFRKGLVVEQEHADTVDGDMIQVARIALDHLEEIPDYYTRLLAMEREAKGY